MSRSLAFLISVVLVLPLAGTRAVLGDVSSSVGRSIVSAGGQNPPGQLAFGRRDPNQVVRIAVLQAGTRHSKKGNPGCEANFSLLAGLARDAARTTPDLIVLPEYAISGWPNLRPPGYGPNEPLFQKFPIPRTLRKPQHLRDTTSNQHVDHDDHVAHKSSCKLVACQVTSYRPPTA